jgi:hypothetical protein
MCMGFDKVGGEIMPMTLWSAIKKKLVLYDGVGPLTTHASYLQIELKMGNNLKS